VLPRRLATQADLLRIHTELDKHALVVAHYYHFHSLLVKQRVGTLKSQGTTRHSAME
jgi:hypothetical protein